jgi:F-type H+-transporting ATPase subunit gamma
MAQGAISDIKSRIKSIESTKQITKAMELVATSKLRRQRQRASDTLPFQRMLKKSINVVAKCLDACDNPLKDAHNDNKTLQIVIAGDRGLAAGYNANVLKYAKMRGEGRDVTVLPIGKKAYEHYKSHGAKLLTDELLLASDVKVGTAQTLAQRIAVDYVYGKFSRVEIIYTEFKSMLTQSPTAIQILPLEYEPTEDDATPEFDISADEMLQRIIPFYISGIIHTSICQSLASESGARRTAMNAANKNACEMIDNLMLSYNRARQAAITQEITEIVSGAEAL